VIERFWSKFSWLISLKVFDLQLTYFDIWRFPRVSASMLIFIKMRIFNVHFYFKCAWFDMELSSVENRLSLKKDGSTLMFFAATVITTATSVRITGALIVKALFFFYCILWHEIGIFWREVIQQWRKFHLKCLNCHQ